MNSQDKTYTKKRFEPLDYLRGLVMGFIVITEQIGSSYSWPFLNHATWVGFTFTDWLFPCLIVCMGFAMVFSFKKINKIDGSFIKKVLVRGILLIAIGIALNFFDGFFSRLYDGMGVATFMDALHNLRFYGILQRIGFVYIIGAFIIMFLKKNPIKILIIGCTILFAYLFILGIGHGYEYTTKNIVFIVDNSIFPANHLYKKTIEGVTLTLDPEGLISMISTIAQLLLAFGIGKLFIERYNKDQKKSTIILFAASVLLIVLGLAISMFAPLLKKVWSASYVLLTTGISFGVISVFCFITLKRPHENAFLVLKVLGVNALSIFVVSNILTYLIKYVHFGDYFIKHYIFDALCIICFSDVFLASFLCALVILSLIWFIAWLLYRNNIIIKL